MLSCDGFIINPSDNKDDSFVVLILSKNQRCVEEVLDFLYDAVDDDFLERLEGFFNEDV